MKIDREWQCNVYIHKFLYGIFLWGKTEERETGEYDGWRRTMSLILNTIVVVCRPILPYFTHISDDRFNEIIDGSRSVHS